MSARGLEWASIASRQTTLRSAGRGFWVGLSGGAGGWLDKLSSEKARSGSRKKSCGGLKTKTGCSETNSIFCNGIGNSDFCSDFLPSLMALQRRQGCWPSKVFSKDSVTEAARRFPASMFVHATVCSTAQCPPTAATSATISSTWPSFRNTRELSGSHRLVSNKGCSASNSLALALWLAGPAKAELMLDGSPAHHVAAQTEIDAANFPPHTRGVRKTKRRLLFNQNNFA